MIVPSRGNVAGTLWGLNAFSYRQNYTVHRNGRRNQGVTVLPKERTAWQTGSLSGAFQTYGVHGLIPQCVGSSGMSHTVFSTAWAQTDIVLPDSFHHISNRTAGKKRHKFLMPLNAEDDVKIFLFATVIQKTIVADFLKSGRKHMHHQPADKLIRSSRNKDCLTGFVIFCPKGNFFFCNGDNS